MNAAMSNANSSSRPHGVDRHRPAACLTPSCRRAVPSTSPLSHSASMAIPLSRGAGARVNLLWGYTLAESWPVPLLLRWADMPSGCTSCCTSGKLGQIQSDIPDFNVFLEFLAKYPATGGLRALVPFTNFWFAVAAVVWVAAGHSLLSSAGWRFVRASRCVFLHSQPGGDLRGLPDVFRNDFRLWRNNGLTDFNSSWATPSMLRHQAGLYNCLRPFVARHLFALQLARLDRSSASFRRAIRDSEDRVLFSGYSTASVQTVCFRLAAIIAGLGVGALRAAGRDHHPERRKDGPGPEKQRGSRSRPCLVRRGWARQSAWSHPRAPSAATHSRATLLTPFAEQMALYPQRALYFRDVVHGEWESSGCPRSWLAFKGVFW